MNSGDQIIKIISIFFIAVAFFVLCATFIIVSQSQAEMDAKKYESKMAIIYQLSTNNTPCEEMVLFVKDNF